jgi:hypothetical protein
VELAVVLEQMGQMVEQMLIQQQEQAFHLL